MRLLSAAMAVTLLFAWTHDVDARERRKSDHDATVYDRDARSVKRRSTTTDRNGLCVRDTGKPFHSLRLNDQCDREEFWARFNDYGNDRN